MFDGVGFIGLGKMGGPIATRLLAKCDRLTVYDTRPAAAELLKTHGAILADSPAEVAANAEVAFMSLPNPDIVRQVALGPGGIAGGGKLKILVDLSTTGAGGRRPRRKRNRPGRCARERWGRRCRQGNPCSYGCGVS